MTHDPLCTFAPCECYKDGSGFHSCGTDGCQCDLIAKVRADERVKAAMRVNILPSGANLSVAAAAAAGDVDAGVGC